MSLLTRLAAVAATLALVVPSSAATATAAPATSALERARVDAVPTPTLHWRTCDVGECATVTLPLDYDEPDGATVDIALSRIPARNPARRIGSLFLNPGGPGGSGVQFPARAQEWLGEDVLAGIQTLNVGQGVEAGLAIVALAMVIDRISQAYGRAGR